MIMMMRQLLCPTVSGLADVLQQWNKKIILYMLMGLSEEGDVTSRALNRNPIFRHKFPILRLRRAFIVFPYALKVKI